MLSSMAKLWPANFGHLGIDWLLGIFRFLQVTFLKTLTSTRRLSAGVERHQLDENGNPLREDEARLKLGTSVPVKDQRSSGSLERQPQRTAVLTTTTDGKTEKGAKDAPRKGKPTKKSSIQTKQRTQRAKKNETGTGEGKALESKGRMYNCEIENQNKANNEVKNSEEECFEECDDEVTFSTEKCSVKDLCKEKTEEINETEIDGESSPCEILQFQASHVAEISKDVKPNTVSGETMAKEMVATGGSRPRKKRRKGKGAKQMSGASASSPGALTLPAGDQNPNTTSDLVGKVDKSESPLTPPVSCVVMLPAVNSTMFGGITPGNSRQKPSARVPPSRSTSTTDCALNSTDVDSSRQPKASRVDLLSADAKSDDLKSCCRPVEIYQNSVGVMSCVELGDGSNQVLKAEVTSLTGVTTSTFERSRSLMAEVGKDVSRRDTFLEQRQLSPVSKSTFYGFVKCPSTFTRPKPQSLVNPFSFESSAAKPPHAGPRAVEIKPGYVEPPRFRPRSTVNPLPAGSPQTRVRSNVRIEDSASTVVSSPASVDFPKPWTTRVPDSRPEISETQKKLSACEENWPSTAYMYVEDDPRDFNCLSNCSEFFPSVDEGSGAARVVDRIVHGCHRNGFPGHQESSHSVVPLIRYRTNERYIESSPMRTPHRRVANKQPVCTKGNQDHGPVLVPDPVQSSAPGVRRDFRNAAVKGSDFQGTGKRATGNPKNMKTSHNRKNFELRTNFFRQNSFQHNDVREPFVQANFDLSRARHFLHSEFLNVVEKQTQRSCDVVEFRCN